MNPALGVALYGIMTQRMTQRADRQSPRVPGIMEKSTRAILLKMMRRSIYLHALNYGRSRARVDSKALIEVVQLFDQTKAKKR